MLRRHFLRASFSAFAVATLPSESTAGDKLASAARNQIGVTTAYDPRYIRIPYPNGDVLRTSGVCADVIVRAYRDALALDLQKLLHEDMQANFAAYPRTWGMAHPDANIDHRRVINLEAFWTRANGRLWQASQPTAGDAFPQPLAVGDLLTWRLNAKFPHVAIVSATSGSLFHPGPRVIHNWGNGAEELPLSTFSPHRAQGHYRWPKA